MNNKSKLTSTNAMSSIIVKNIHSETFPLDVKGQGDSFNTFHEQIYPIPLKSF